MPVLNIILKNDNKISNQVITKEQIFFFILISREGKTFTAGERYEKTVKRLITPYVIIFGNMGYVPDVSRRKQNTLSVNTGNGLR